MDVRDHLRTAPVVPVLTIERVEDAAPLARALVAGGLRVLEVTLRTPVALEAIRRIGGEAPEAIVAAGTIRSTTDLAAAAAAGARLAFSPGMADFMLEAGPIPILPGVATPSEAMKALDRGVSTLKFFPAVPAGGVAMLKSLAAPFPEATFCPTGGVDKANAGDFLALPNVLCVGGSWVAPRRMVEAGDWSAISDLAREAASLRRGA